MLTCAHSCIGKKLNSLPAACAGPLPIEPLLFLYPRWYQHAINRGVYIESYRARNFSSGSKRRKPVPKASSGYGNNSSVSVTAGQRTSKRDELKTQKHEPPAVGPFDLTESWLAKGWRPYKQNVKDELHLKSQESSNIVPVKDRVPTHKKAVREIRGSVVLDLANKLAKLRPRSSNDQPAISVDAAFLEWLTGTAEENVWKHADGSGCLVHVTAPTRECGAERSMVLVGSHRAREITQRHLNELQNQFSNVVRSQSANETPNETSAAFNGYQRVDQQRRPNVWSLSSFSAYVKSIVTSQAPKNIERTLYGKEESFNKVAARVLMELFTDSELQQFHSSFALRHALDFCSTRTDIAFAARAIWTAVKAAGVVPDVTCFNFEISRCIRVGNLGGVKRLINEMRDDWVQPNAATWAHLLKLLRTEKDHLEVLQVPLVQDMSHSQDAIEVMVRAFLETTFEPSDDEPLCVEILQRRMLGAFGDNWLTPTAISTMLDLCNEARAPKTVSRVLQLAARLSVKLDPIPFTHLLKAVAQAGWFEDMLLLLKMQRFDSDVHLTQDQIEIAFTTAWKRRLVNTCRVLWHYGASHGAIRHNMMTKVAKAVAQNVHPEAESPKNVTASMAATIIGTDRYLSSNRPRSVVNGKDVLSSDTVAALGKWTPGGETRHNQLQVAHILIEREVTAWQRFTPMSHSTLCKLLEEALALDMLWQNQDTLSKLSLPDLVHEAIHIDLQPIEMTSNLTQKSAAAVSISGHISSSEVQAAPPIFASNHRSKQAQHLRQDEHYHSHEGSERHSHQLGFQNVCKSDMYSKKSSATMIVSPAERSTPAAQPLFHCLNMKREDST